MRKRIVRAVLLVLFLGILTSLSMTQNVSAQTVFPDPVVSVEPTPRPDLTVESKASVGPLEEILDQQKIGLFWANPLKYAIRSSVASGVPANTIVLLLLLPVVGALIAATRHIIGVRGFGIFLPAALSVVFISTGPVLGIGLFLVIVIASTLMRIFLRRVALAKFQFRLQYLPKMALILWFVVIAILLVLFATPFIKSQNLANVSIFPILILVLLAENFSKVQIGKSVRVAVNLTTETLILALVSFTLLTYTPAHELVLLNPELTLLVTLMFILLIGRYAGLRFVEYWRFRKLISR